MAPRPAPPYPCTSLCLSQQGIEAITDTNYFQIDETKYGKPMIDRVVKFDTPIKEVAKCLLVSFDSTMRSNLSVGLPIDLLGYETAEVPDVSWS